MRPARRTLLWAGAAMVAALVPSVAGGSLWPVWASLAMFSLLAPALDALLAAAPGQVRHEVKTDGRAYVGCEHRVEVTIHVLGRSAPDELRLRLELDGDVTPAVETRVSLKEGRGRATLSITAWRRGRVHLAEIWLQWRGPLGFVTRQVRRETSRPLEVLPNLNLVRDAALTYAKSVDSLAGQHQERVAGDGSEFDSIREFVPGFDPRAIHWKASARHRKLLVREFRAERDHQIVVAVDCGYLMGETLGAIPRLDHAINSGLLLAWIGLRFGDRVGMYGFDAEPRLYVSPRSGVTQFPRLVAATPELDYSRHETNFTLGLVHLATRLRHRGMIVILTDFVDSITAELMVENLSRVAQQHLVLFVALRDPSLDALAHGDPRVIGDVGRSVVAFDMLRERDLVLKRLQREGVLTLDVTPSRLSAGLINRYLEIKKRELIA